MRQGTFHLFVMTIAALAAWGPARADDFADWHGQCTDAGLCLLVNHSSAADGTDAVLALRRGSGPAAPWQVLVTPLAPSADLTHPFSFSIDGAPRLTFSPDYDFRSYGAADNLYLVNIGLAERLLSEMLAGTRADLAYQPTDGGNASVRFRLAGLRNGLDWIDAQQSRSDVSRNVGLPDDLAPHESMAGRASPIDGGAGAWGLPNNLLAIHYGLGGCEALDSPLMGETEPASGRLSNSAVLHAIPCTAGGGHVDYRIYVVETGEIGGIEMIPFAKYGARFGWTGTDLLANARFDASTGELVSVSDRRGADGCGHAARWHWLDWQFAMVEYRYRATCSGPASPDRWPLVFRLAE